MKLEGLKPASVLHFSQFDQLINAAVAGQGVALGRSPLLKQMLRDRRLVAPFKKTVASPRSYYLVRSATAARKPEAQDFAAWVTAEALTASGPGSSSLAGRVRA